MQIRLPLWTALFVFAALGALRAQTPAATTPPVTAPAAADTMEEGRIIAKKVTGKVSMTLNGVTTDLQDDQRVSQHATIVTGNDSSVILIFANGATTQLGADTTLSIDEFMMDPFDQKVALATLTEEPTRSRTQLHLTKGELLGKVVHLNQEKGSTFNVVTPVGAAGIRGTIFRIVFRPTGTGQAFAVFSLSTLEGNVHFQQQGTGEQPGTPPGPGQPGGQPPGGQQPGGQPAGGQPPTGGVPVVTGQEVVVTVEVNVNAQGVPVVTAPPVITSTQEIPPATKAAIALQAQTVATTAASVTFTAATSGGTSTSATSTSSDSAKKDDSTDKKDNSSKGDSNSSNGTSGGDSTSGTSSSGTSSSTTSSGTTSTSSASTSGPTQSGSASVTSTSTSTGSVSAPPVSNTPTVNNPVVPPPTSTLPQLTPLAGGHG